jgi:hypothetical protein
MTTSEISVGQSYFDDEGDQVTVRKIRHSQGTVVLEGENGTYEMSLDDLLQAVSDGEFEEIDDEDADE